MSDQNENAGFIPVDPSLDGQAADLLAGWTTFLGFDDGAAMLAAWRADERVALHGVTLNDDLVVAIVTRQVHLMDELIAITVRADLRGHGIGELALADTVRRSGRRPLVVECPEEMRPWFLKKGFKMVGKRTGPSGEARYRLGAHAPRQTTPESEEQAE
jgi:GNAT superfamily N-acetyltransferase